MKSVKFVSFVESLIMSANYDLNSSLPAHEIEDYDHTNQHTSTPYDHLTPSNDTSYAGMATTSGNGHNGHNNNNHETNGNGGYQSFKQMDTRRGDLNNNEDHHMMDDDNKSVLSKLLERSKLISEVLEATYAKPTSYVKYARQEQREGIDDDMASVLMQQEFETGHRVKFGMC